ncbi:MAG TPA: Holliday junction branch migration protein RuvA [Hellea balneolensis]|uniref:Holliday junction branch migration complex subunit RuvA n=1 Tax=Hellea balneolensis TaxID=287478 RepID=A0A7C5LZ74_9PROT|nr:Holliday junction branch migration protein RuvA [Hellea balneolensis]
MIGQLTGTVTLIGVGEAIINVGGVGYLVKCGARTLASLQIGEISTLQVETHVRETAIVLFGFADEQERAWFVRLQSVQKVGPKAALAILDVLSPAEILSAAALEDKAAFARASGVGPSLAGRIVLDLAGKPAPLGRGFSQDFADTSSTVNAVPAMPGGAHKDAVSALVNLGIGQTEALRAVASAGKIVDEGDVNALVKAALKELGT